MSLASSDLEEDTCSFYYGNISRESAEYILWDKGCVDSMFLLRKSNSDYVLSLCHQKSILHYRISRLSTGEVILHGLEAQKFANIEKLLQNVEGLATKPCLPCERFTGWQLPPTYWGLSLAEIRSAIISKSHEWGIANSLVTFPFDHLLPENEEYNRSIMTKVTKSLINKILHEIQPWYHGKLTRLEAENSLEESGHKEGKFLVRERDESSYALCLSHEGTAKHYRIDILSSGEFAIQDGHKFSSIMSLVSHYTVFTDGLWTSLGEPCPKLYTRIPSFSVNNGDVILHRSAFDSSTPPPTFTVRRNFSPHCSPLIERSRNSLNNNRIINHRSMSVHTSDKLKEWFNTINHKWSKLLCAVTARHGPDRILVDGNHFSTLPRDQRLPHRAQLPIYFSDGEQVILMKKFLKAPLND